MNTYKVEYVLEITYSITVEANSREEASDKANEIDLADWTETGCNTVGYEIVNLTGEDDEDE